MARLLFFASSALLLQAALGFIPGRMPMTKAPKARFQSVRMAASADEYRAAYNVRTYTLQTGLHNTYFQKSHAVTRTLRLITRTPNAKPTTGPERDGGQGQLCPYHGPLGMARCWYFRPSKG